MDIGAQLLFDIRSSGFHPQQAKGLSLYSEFAKNFPKMGIT